MPFSPKTKIAARALVPGALGLLLGRVAVFQFVSPLALAFAAGWLGTGGFYVTAALTLAGVLSAMPRMYIVRYIAAFILMGAANALFAPRLGGVIPRAAAASGSALAAGLMFAALRGMSAYFFVAAVIEGVFVFCAAIVADKAAAVLKSPRRARPLAAEEQISLGMLAAAAIIGAADIRVGPLSLGWVFLCALVPAISHRLGGPAGGSAALLLGVAMSVGGKAGQAMPATLGVAAITAGAFRGGPGRGSRPVGGGARSLPVDAAKLKTAAGFVAGLAASALFAGSLPPVSVFGAALAGAAVFVFAPFEFYFDTGGGHCGGEYTARVKTVVSQRLYGFSHSFSRLSRTFSALAQPRTGPEGGGLNRLIDDIAETACRKCARRGFCWERGFYDTHRAMGEILKICAEKNRIDASDIPQGFRAACISAPWLAEAVNRQYELYRLNMYWQNRTAESRGLISEQLGGVSKLIQSLASELDVFMNFKPGLEESLYGELSKNGIEVTQVIVLENRQGKYEVSVRPRGCPGRANCAKGLARAAGRVLGRRMRAEDGQCTYSRGCSMRLVEEQRFRIASGVACSSKTGSPVSGDSYSFMELRGGQCLLALSDGMGSGEKAREESAAAVELLEDFIESGFEKDMAVKMINSVLVLGGDEESFSTLDICSIDLHTGQAEFVKIGAAATYILRGGEVSVIKSSSLPIGMLGTVDIEVSSRELKENDIIIMATDGFADAAPRGQDKERWISAALSGLGGRSPQDIADRLMAAAERGSDGLNKDDITILAARIWQRG